MISAILLAAGESKRMTNGNKLIKQYKGIPLIKHTINNILSSSVDELIIVLGHEKDKIEKIIEKNEKIKIIYNPDFKSGMASSIKVGLFNLSAGCQAFFICLADMPNVSKIIYDKLIAKKFKHTDKEIYVPYYKKRQANPILFSISMKEKLKEIEGDLGAKKIIADNQKKISKLLTEEKGVITDFNDLKDFKPK